MTRLNTVIDRLTNGLIASSSLPITNGNEELARRYGDSDLDMVIFDMEHQGFDFTGLKRALAAMLNRGRIAQHGLTASPAPFVRLPTPAREVTDWMIKLALDLGVYGIVIPTLETVEEAWAITHACRYPAPHSSEPSGGRRGYWPDGAARYWGIDPLEYVRRADVWPLNPDGELLIIGIIESVKGAENLDAILEARTGIGAIMPGPGDLFADLGLLGDWTNPTGTELFARIKRTCTDHGVVWLGGAMTPDDVATEVDAGARIIVEPQFGSGVSTAVRNFSAH